MVDSMNFKKCGKEKRLKTQLNFSYNRWSLQKYQATVLS